MVRCAYPIKDRENLELLLAEDEALARALDSEEELDAVGWASSALRIRQKRASRLEPSGAMPYGVPSELQSQTGTRSAAGEATRSAPSGEKKSDFGKPSGYSRQPTSSPVRPSHSRSVWS